MSDSYWGVIGRAYRSKWRRFTTWLREYAGRG